MASLLNWLFGKAKNVPIVYPPNEKKSNRIPVVYPASAFLQYADAVNVPTVFSPDVDVFAYGAEPVVYAPGELRNNAIQDAGLEPNVWYKGGSRAIAGHMFQPYGPGAEVGGVWIQFTSSSKKYLYPNVPATEFVSLHNSPSLGRFVNHVLRPLFSVGIGRTWNVPAGRKYVK